MSCCPPDARCKLFNVDNAWLKSEIRFLNGPWAPDLLRELHHFYLYRKCSGSVIRQVKSSSASSSHLRRTSSSRSCSIIRISQETIVHPSEFPLDTSHFQIMDLNDIVSGIFTCLA